jgi:glucose/mannose-6-phosphate isomerase
MKDLVAGFSEQLKEAVEIAQAYKPSFTKGEFKNVFISGLGGSGIGGSIVSELAALSSPIPVTVGKGYFIPAFVGPETLVIISSYSGDTEETVNALELALQAGARPVCITSGGKISHIAKEQGLDLIVIPGGNPPRACLGYSLTQLINVFVHAGLLPATSLNDIKKGNDYLIANEDAIRAKGLKMAEFLANKLPVIYATTYNEGVAIRFRQQLNENSKVLCWHHVFPEMNHNELVGWAQKNENIAVVVLRDPDEYKRNQFRIELSKEIFAKYTSNIMEIVAVGDSPIERTLYFIHLTDWVSCYLADLRNVNPVEIQVINHLKSELSKVE